MQTTLKSPLKSFDYAQILPEGQPMFRVRDLAKIWDCCGLHVLELIECGEIPTSVDLKIRLNCQRSMIRIPREAVIAFLNSRRTAGFAKRTLPKPFDFADLLPKGRALFSIRELADNWRCCRYHVFKLILSGEIPTSIDLRNGKTKAMIRIPRQAVVAFLNARRDI